jgi:N-acetylmuramoyl-L-alanine amidase
MKNSPIPFLARVPTLVLAAGHGAKDTGACVPGFNERDECIWIVDEMERLLRPFLGTALVIAPHRHDTHETIPWLNARYPYLASAWALEIHRDSASTVSGEDADLRCGIYYGTSSDSRSIANIALGSLIAHGAHPRRSWTLCHTDSPHKSLGWIRQPFCLSHLMELGFMEGRNDPAHLSRLARMAAGALLKTFAGQSLPPA